MSEVKLGLTHRHSKAVLDDAANYLSFAIRRMPFGIYETALKRLFIHLSINIGILDEVSVQKPIEYASEKRLLE